MHPYLCFSRQSADPITVRATQPCGAWGSLFNKNFGFIIAGEFSNAVTDCGTYVNGVGQGVRYEGTYTLDGSHPNLCNCDTDWLDYENWDSATKKAYLTFAKSSMDTLQVHFPFPLHMTDDSEEPPWKIGNSTAGSTRCR
jgi:glucan 1,3-beta-glucosidase